MQPRLPKLIFAENHSDPITKKILAKLAPKLKKLGYECFFDEYPPNTTLKSAINEMEEWENQFHNLKKAFENNKLDINKPDDLISYALIIANKTKIDFLEIMKELKSLIIRRDGRLAYKNLYETLQENSLSYVGIDLSKKMIDESVESKDLSKRDDQMTNAYLKTNKNVFGLIGLEHSIGMQKKILEEMDKSTASANFCFFHIFSRQDSNDIENRVRAGKEQFSFGITPIDAQSLSEDKIIYIIINEIKKRYDLLQKSKDESSLSKEIKSDQSTSFKINESKALSEQKIILSTKQLSFFNAQANIQNLSDLYKVLEKIDCSKRADLIRKNMGIVKYATDMPKLLKLLPTSEQLTIAIEIAEKHKYCIANGYQLAIVLDGLANQDDRNRLVEKYKHEIKDQDDLDRVNEKLDKKIQLSFAPTEKMSC